MDDRPAFYGVAGEGMPVVLLHGWALGHHTYRRVMQRIAGILRQEMDAIAMEVSMPVLQPAALCGRGAGFLFALTTRDWSWLAPGTLVGASVGFRIWSRRLRDNDPGGGPMPPPAI